MEVSTDYRYFVVPILISTSGCDTFLGYHCRVINNSYMELFNLTLNSKDANSFEEIMRGDKAALLCRKHEILKDVAYWKIEKCKNIVIPNL